MTVLDVTNLVDGQPADPDPLKANLQALEAISPPIGASMPYDGTGDPSGGHWLLRDGRLIDKTVCAAYFAAVGHAFNGGVDPGSNKVRIGDARGRFIMGADNMGTAQGAASRIAVATATRGANGGAERVTLAAAESGVNSNGSTVSGGAHQHYLQGEQFTPGGGLSTHMQFGGFDASFVATYGDSLSNHSHVLAARAADSSHQNLPLYECANVITRVL